MPSAREHLERLAAAPRPAGSSAEAEARAWCDSVLGAQGFTVSPVPFEYSTIPGRLATPALGLIGVLVLCGAAHLGWRDRPALAAAVLVAGGAVVAAAVLWLTRRGTQRLPWGRRVAINLVAVRGPAPVHLWLVAHLDSKSQPVSIFVRALGIGLLVVVWVVAMAMALAQHAGTMHELAHEIWPWLAVAALAAGAPVVSSGIGVRSPGAVDNASGVATLLRVAELAPRDAAFGVLVTSAEELGLAGARAWINSARLPMGAALNVDTVDDRGRVRLMYTGRRAVGASLLARLRTAMPTARIGRLLPGVLADSVALSDAGWMSVTVSKGTWRTLVRIHTADDNLRALSGSGVEEVARALAGVVAGTSS